MTNALARDKKESLKIVISTNTNPRSKERPSVKPAVKETPSDQTETGQPNPEPPNKRPKKDDEKHYEDLVEREDHAIRIFLKRKAEIDEYL